MNRFLKGLFFFICFFSSIGLSATSDQKSVTPKHHVRIYLDQNGLEITKNAIYVRIEDNLIETKAIRTDQQGIYIFERDIANYGSANLDKKWKCPYCNQWWLIGEKCQNKDCPTNKW